MKKIFLLFLFVLTSCGGETVQLEQQEFDGNTYQIEARPGPVVLKGMNEFIVIISNKHNQPVADLIISLRTEEKNDWRQMIQDGKVGVYRRAIDIKNPETDYLQVQVRKKDKAGELTVLKFPLFN